jgi:hypothetical protein
MSSIAHQVFRCLSILKLSKEEIDQMKAELGVNSLKKALRPNGDPTKPLPKILGNGTYVTYFRECRFFFRLAKELTSEPLLRNLLTHDVIMLTFENHYLGLADGSISKLQPAIKKVFEGASQLGWVHGPCPIKNELRDARPDHVRKHRDGYLPFSETYTNLHIGRLLFGSCFNENCLVTRTDALSTGVSFWETPGSQLFKIQRGIQVAVDH